MSIIELWRWGVKSIGGLAANLVLLTVWVDGVGIWPEVAIGINWVLISVAGYAITDAWVFENADSASTRWGHVKRYLGMQGVMASSKVVNYAIYVGLMQFGVDYRVSWAVGAVAVFAYTFAGNRKIWDGGLNVTEGL